MKKLLSFLLALVFCFTFAFTAISCDNSVKGANDASKDGAPDYSASTKKMNMYAFLGPTTGSFTTQNGDRVNIGDQRTLERYKEYKECGFDVLLLLGNDAGYYAGVNEFEVITDQNKEEQIAANKAYFDGTASNGLKMNLELAAQADLDVIVFDGRVHTLTTVEEYGLIKEEGQAAKPIIIDTATGGRFVAPFRNVTVDIAGGTVTSGTTPHRIRSIRYQFEDMADLIRTLEVWTSPYIDHEAFYGMSMFDEPQNPKLKSVGQVDRALYALDEDMFVQTCLLPYYGGNSAILSVSSATEFQKYLQEYLDETKSEYFGYDYYPMFETDGITTMQSTYLNCLQMSAKMANKNDCNWEIIIQTYAQGGGLRPNTYADVDLQMNLALAFGAYNVGYFTYWMWENISGWNTSFAIMDSYGNKLLYDEVKEVNANGQHLAKTILNYRYEKTKMTFSDVSAPAWYRGVDEEDLDDVTFTSNGNTLVNQMYDKEKDVRGYMVVNAGDPAVKNFSLTTLNFDGFENVMIIRDGETMYKKLNKGAIDVYLSEGEGAFFIPYNS